MRAPIGIDPGQRARDIGLAIDDVAVIDDDRGNLREPQAPGFNDTLIRGGEITLKRGTSFLQTCSNQFSRASRIGRKVRPEWSSDARGRIEQNDARAAIGPNRMRLIRKDTNVSAERGSRGAECGDDTDEPRAA